MGLPVQFIDPQKITTHNVLPLFGSLKKERFAKKILTKVFIFSNLFYFTPNRYNNNKQHKNNSYNTWKKKKKKKKIYIYIYIYIFPNNQI